MDPATAIGVALALLGLVDLAIKYGQWSKEGCDKALKQSLQVFIGLLCDEITKAEQLLETSGGRGFLGRLSFSVYGERSCKSINKALREHQRELAELLIIKDIETRVIPGPVLLSLARFQHNLRRGYTAVPYTSNLFIAQAGYKEDSNEAAIRNVDVLVERRGGNLATISAYLHFRLSDDTSRPGVLRCLGYRLDPEPELVFELPEGATNPQTLQTIIASDQGQASHSLDFRFRLGRRLAEAVLGANSAGLVHKSIRAETVLVLQREGLAADGKAGKRLGDVFLPDWHLLRRHSDISTQGTVREERDWTWNIYRHPNRQGTQRLEERYNVGHDVYSLGVCLLEIGVWNVLTEIRNADGHPRICGLFRAAAKVDSTQDPEAQLQSLLATPEDIKTVL